MGLATYLDQELAVATWFRNSDISGYQQSANIAVKYLRYVGLRFNHVNVWNSFAKKLEEDESLVFSDEGGKLGRLIDYEDEDLENYMTSIKVPHIVPVWYGGESFSS